MYYETLETNAKAKADYNKRQRELGEGKRVCGKHDPREKRTIQSPHEMRYLSTIRNEMTRKSGASNHIGSKPGTFAEIKRKSH